MKTFIYKLLETKSNYAMTLLRVVTGIVFIAHGSQKLFGIFGGYGLEGTGQFMDSIGLHPGYFMALLAGLGEFVGGLMLLLGLFTRIGALTLSIVSLVALFTVHFQHGFFMSNNGYEYILTLLTASVVLIIEGSGNLSIDNVIVKKFKN